MANFMYRKIAMDLRRQVEDGELPPGAQLPTEGELRDKYGQDGKMASRNTIRDAIQLLISLGLVETRPGQGTFVLRKVQPFVTTLSADPKSGLGGKGTSYLSEVSGQDRKPSVSPIKVEIQEASAEIAAGLWGSPRHRGRQLTQEALHRRHSLVNDDVVLPGRVLPPGPGPAGPSRR